MSLSLAAACHHGYRTEFYPASTSALYSKPTVSLALPVFPDDLDILHSAGAYAIGKIHARSAAHFAQALQFVSKAAAARGATHFILIDSKSQERISTTFLQIPIAHALVTTPIEESKEVNDYDYLCLRVSDETKLPANLRAANAENALNVVLRGPL